MTAKQHTDLAHCAGAAMLLRIASVLFWTIGLAVAVIPYFVMLVGLYVIQTGVQFWKYAAVVSDAGRSNLPKLEPKPESEPKQIMTTFVGSIQKGDIEII